MTTHLTNFDQLASPFHRKVIEMKLKQNLMVNLVDVQVVYAAAHFWEGGARCFVGISFGTLCLCSELERVLLNRGIHNLKGKQFGTPHFIAVDRYFSEARKKQLDRVTTGLWKLKGRKTDGKELHGEMELGGKYNLESRGSAFLRRGQEQEAP